MAKLPGSVDRCEEDLVVEDLHDRVGGQDPQPAQLNVGSRLVIRAPDHRTLLKYTQAEIFITVTSPYKKVTYKALSL